MNMYGFRFPAGSHDKHPAGSMQNQRPARDKRERDAGSWHGQLPTTTKVADDAALSARLAERYAIVGVRGWLQGSEREVEGGGGVTRGISGKAKGWVVD